MSNVPSDTLNYFIQTSPGGSLEVALACAADAQPHWQALFEHGLIGAVADDPRLERRLFNHLCIDAVQIHGNPLLRAYLAGLSPKHGDRIFSDSALQDKNHPVNHVFSKAAFTTPGGALARELLATFIAAGLQGKILHALAMRRHKDVLRACSFGNQAFLDLLFAYLQLIPIELLIYVVADETHSSTLVANLVVAGAVPLTDFTNPKVHRFASEKALSLLHAMAARASRQPERAIY
ncbi:hypothetical protein [Polaromonas glacialis]|uniref:hypothetical protein n=1 Tax=Polaromonas glacialis TaxID=866564 RepID=UPI000B2DEA40|nr:hypothetical protein [Polaromonas glacialis]